MMARVALVVCVLFLLTACGNDPNAPDQKPGGHFGVTTVHVGDRDVPCVTWKQGYAGGLSCDWAP